MWFAHLVYEQVQPCDRHESLCMFHHVSSKEKHWERSTKTVFFSHIWTSFPYPGAAMSQRPSLRLPDGLVIRGKKHMRCKGVETALSGSPPFRFKMVTYWDNKCDKSGSTDPKALNGFRHVQVAVWVFVNGMCQVLCTGSGMCQFPLDLWTKLKLPRGER